VAVRSWRSIPGADRRRALPLDLGAGTDVAVVRGWFGVRPRDWHQPTGQRFVVHTINETTVEQGGIELGANPRLAAELYPHLAEPVCQHCDAPAGCPHLGRALELGAIGERPMAA
jgi:hypothetical protein